MSRQKLRQKLRTMLSVSAIFIIFAISYHHSYTGVLHIWQSILKAIYIGVIRFNYSLKTAVLLINFDESYMFCPNDTWISAQLPDRKNFGGGHMPPVPLSQPIRL
jgi:hypothetical protein